jgi:AraC family transcriptional regulator, transcriptional activator FtrA
MDIVRKNLAIDPICAGQDDQSVATTQPHVVTVVGEGTSMFDLSVAYEVFGRRPPIEGPWYRFTVATEVPGAVQLDVGLSLTIKRGLSAFRTADTIIVAGWPEAAAASPALLRALRSAHRRGVRMVSFCSGTFLLAAAGLLDGQRATTHWDATDRFRSRYPRVDVKEDVLYVDNGDVLTSAGSAAAIDLAIHLVRNDYGTRVANLVARQLVVAPHRHGAQAQFVTTPATTIAPSDNLACTLDWIIGHLEHDLSLTAMANNANLSTRQFSRRFKETTGTTPHHWLLRQRILRACALLEQGTMSIEEVAHQCGFDSAAAMRPHFARFLTTSPAAYKRSHASRTTPPAIER